MKFIRENIEINIDVNIGELKSIKIDNTEILYQGDQQWKKTFPILFPVVGIVKNWKINGKNVKIPKHGYWKELKWNVFQEYDDIIITSICEPNLLPYLLDISLRISISNSRITLTTLITNASIENAYFHFGWHPAFIIDKSSMLSMNKNEKAMIVNNNGIIEKNNTIDINRKKINELPFNDNIDSFIFLETEITHAVLKNKKYELNLYFDEPNLVIWKKQCDDFICIEPYHGYSDQFDDEKFIEEIELKPNIIELSSLDSFTSMYIINYKLNKKTN